MLSAILAACLLNDAFVSPLLIERAIQASRLWFSLTAGMIHLLFLSTKKGDPLSSFVENS